MARRLAVAFVVAVVLGVLAGYVLTPPGTDTPPPATHQPTPASAVTPGMLQDDTPKEKPVEFDPSDHMPRPYVWGSDPIERDVDPGHFGMPDMPFGPITTPLADRK